MEKRSLSPIDRLVAGIDDALRTVAGPTRHTRTNPAADVADGDMTPQEKSHAAGLMRVNHAGEVAAQGLYQGHAAVARDTAVAEQMQHAADEELDHLGWCEERLRELGENPSVLSPIWYAGSFALGAASGILGDRWSLGFVEETERQVSEHLTSHLRSLPKNDARSRAIVEQMRTEEEQHGADAHAAGARPLPGVVRQLMRATAKIMTRTAYRL